MDPTEKNKTIPITINGKHYEVPALVKSGPKNELTPITILQACELVGVKVPHFCYHPGLQIAGNCRMCLVEIGTPVIGPDKKPVLKPDGTLMIRKSPRPVISCATPVTPHMEVYTETPAVKAMRKGVMEFLLINHPLDCPICDQAGECKLQEYALDHGFSESKFIEQKIKKPKQVDFGPKLILDNERCILCTRCIRFARDISGDESIGIINRGTHSSIAVWPGSSFDNDYAINIADICPVGALTSRDFRFRMRLWFLKETKSICPECATGCNIIIASRENQIYRITPRKNESVNSFWMCDYGRLAFKWIHDSQRLTSPIIRKDDSAEQVTIKWDQAIDLVSSILKRNATGASAIIVSAKQTLEELYLIKRLAVQLNAITDSIPHTGKSDDFLISADKTPNFNGIKLLSLAPKNPGTSLGKISELIARGDIRVLIAFGENVADLIGETICERVENLIVFDVLPNTTTRLASVVLPACAFAEKPGTFINRNGRLQKFHPAIAPPQGVQPEWITLCHILERLTGKNEPTTFSELFSKMSSEVPNLKSISWDIIGDEGIQLDDF
jgi:NADH-quinone oxidoreductase subunit G